MCDHVKEAEVPTFVCQDCGGRKLCGPCERVHDEEHHLIKFSSPADYHAYAATPAPVVTVVMGSTRTIIGCGRTVDVREPMWLHAPERLWPCRTLILHAELFPIRDPALRQAFVRRLVNARHQGEGTEQIYMCVRAWEDLPLVHPSFVYTFYSCDCTTARPCTATWAQICAKLGPDRVSERRCTWGLAPAVPVVATPIKNTEQQVIRVFENADPLATLAAEPYYKQIANKKHVHVGMAHDTVHLLPESATERTTFCTLESWLSAPATCPCDVLIFHPGVFTRDRDMWVRFRGRLSRTLIQDEGTSLILFLVRRLYEMPVLHPSFKFAYKHWDAMHPGRDVPWQDVCMELAPSRRLLQDDELPTSVAAASATVKTCTEQASATIISLAKTGAAQTPVAPDSSTAAHGTFHASGGPANIASDMPNIAVDEAGRVFTTAMEPARSAPAVVDTTLAKTCAAPASIANGKDQIVLANAAKEQTAVTAATKQDKYDLNAGGVDATTAKEMKLPSFHVLRTSDSSFQHPVIPDDSFRAGDTVAMINCAHVPVTRQDAAFFAYSRVQSLTTPVDVLVWDVSRGFPSPHGEPDMDLIHCIRRGLVRRLVIITCSRFHQSPVHDRRFTYKSYWTNGFTVHVWDAVREKIVGCYEPHEQPTMRTVLDRGTDFTMFQPRHGYLAAKADVDISRRFKEAAAAAARPAATHTKTVATSSTSEVAATEVRVLIGDHESRDTHGSASQSYLRSWLTDRRTVHFVGDVSLNGIPLGSSMGFSSWHEWARSLAYDGPWDALVFGRDAFGDPMDHKDDASLCTRLQPFWRKLLACMEGKVDARSRRLIVFHVSCLDALPAVDERFQYISLYLLGPAGPFAWEHVRKEMSSKPQFRWRTLLESSQCSKAPPSKTQAVNLRDMDACPGQRLKEASAKATPAAAPLPETGTAKQAEVKTTPAESVLGGQKLSPSAETASTPPSTEVCVLVGDHFSKDGGAHASQVMIQGWLANRRCIRLVGDISRGIPFGLAYTGYPTWVDWARDLSTDDKNPWDALVFGPDVFANPGAFDYETFMCALLEPFWRKLNKCLEEHVAARPPRLIIFQVPELAALPAVDERFQYYFCSSDGSVFLEAWSRVHKEMSSKAQFRWRTLLASLSPCSKDPQANTPPVNSREHLVPYTALMNKYASTNVTPTPAQPARPQPAPQVQLAVKETSAATVVVAVRGALTEGRVEEEHAKTVLALSEPARKVHLACKALSPQTVASIHADVKELRAARAAQEKKHPPLQPEKEWTLGHLFAERMRMLADQGFKHPPWQLMPLLLELHRAVPTRDPSVGMPWLVEYLLHLEPLSAAALPGPTIVFPLQLRPRP